MNKKDVLMVGNCIVDQVMTLPHFPQQDEELRALEHTRALGGNAGNAAQVLAALGHNVDLVCSLADDQQAHWILEQLDQAAIGTEQCQSFTQHATPFSTIWLNHENGSRTIAHYRNLPELSLAHLKQIDPDNYRWLHFEGRNIDVLQKFLPSLHDIDATISLEIEKPRDGIEQLIPYVDVVVFASSYVKKRVTTPEYCLQQFNQLNPDAKIACTRGASGIMAMNHNGQIIEMEAESVNHPVDTIGAGDTLIAGLISSMIKGKDFVGGLQQANRLAGQKVQHMGLTQFIKSA